MSLLPITLYGDKILRKKTGKVTEIDNETIELIRDMFATMRNANGIGLAANQVGVDKQIFIIDISRVEGFEEAKPMTIINPRIIGRSEKNNKMEEGCLSIPDIRVDIERPEEITITFQDVDLNEHTITSDDVFARVMQHEYDHLQGILFIDYLTEDQKKEFKKDLDNIKNRNMEVDYPVTDPVR
ncbi:MAG: peptide deformylase [Ignavibacteriales bacterium]|nr:MAG: peptide deformylase [Ignavibacteriales bacterium]